MFNKCIYLEELDVSNLKTKKKEDMKYKFNYCEKVLKIDVCKFETEKVVDFFICLIIVKM